MGNGNNENNGQPPQPQQANTNEFNVVTFLQDLAQVGREPFVNNFELNQTCMVLIVVFVLLFMYKKEVMAMVNKYLK